MVVRLGVTDQELAFRFRILQGQQLHLRYIANTAATVRAWARIHYDDGIDQVLYVPDQVLTGDRLAAVLSLSEVAIADGWVTDAVVECLSDDVNRGQVYVKLIVALESGIFGTVLCSDYVFSSFGQVALGTYVQPGPGGGGGNLGVVTVRFDVVPSDLIYVLALSNTIRKIYGFIWYYNASADVASRTIAVRVRDPYGLTPTGWTGTAPADVWDSTTLTLTASEEGTLFADPKRSGSNDAGVLVIQDAGANPSPFPLLVPEDDVVDLVFTVQNEEANDRDAIYILLEDWVIL